MVAAVKNALKNTTLVFGSMLFGLLALEFGFRWSQGVPLRSAENFIERRLDIIARVSGPIVHDELLGWSLTTNYRAPGFSTGYMGIRENGSQSRVLRKSGIVAVGDSFTHGSGVQDHETWPAHLERRIGVRIHNAAAGGWGVDQMVLRAEQLVPLLSPTTIVVGVLAQDSLRNNFKVYGGGYKPYFQLSGDGLVLSGVPVPTVERAPLTIGFWRRVLGHSLLLDWTMNRLGFTAWWAHDGLMYEQFAENEIGVEITCLLMDRLKRLGDANNLRVIVLLQYGAAESEASEPPWYGPPTLRCARERGFETVDSWPAQHELAVHNRERFVDLWLDEGGQLGHMSAAGNAFIADLLEPLFKRHPEPPPLRHGELPPP